MSESRWIAVDTPTCLVEEVDGLVAQDQSTDSNQNRQGTGMTMQEMKKERLREWMEQGYLEMATLNLRLAAEFYLAETEADLVTMRQASGV
nr:antitoxin [Bacilli bacterium]